MTPSSADRAAGVVLAYNAEIDIVRNIEALRLQVARVFVVNNSPRAGDEVMARVAALDHVEILDQPRNVGVATGFNEGIRAALRAGYDDVWIFDQDSTVAPGMFDAMVEARNSASGDIGIVGPALRSHATGVVYRRERGDGARKVDTLISSGALFTRGVLERLGLHDEGLFIDYVDHDISLRARRLGLSNLKVYSTLLEHRFGDSDPVRLLGRSVYLAHYSPVRQYYMSRNRVILLRRYGVGRWFWEDLGFTTKSWIKVLLLEKDRPAKISAFFRGWRDGLRYDTRASSQAIDEVPGVDPGVNR